MGRSSRRKQLTRRAYMLVAALLLADGEWVGRRELAAGVFEWDVAPTTVSMYLESVDRLMGPVVERRYRHPGHRVQYRMATLPPDEHLEPMLACVPAVKRSAWWQTRRSLIPMTA